LVFTFSFDQQEGALGMIKFLLGSCLSELGIVLKEPSAIYFMDEALLKLKAFFN
jgi:hypothetical protein